jgi:hypothetical protein
MPLTIRLLFSDKHKKCPSNLAQLAAAAKFLIRPIVTRLRRASLRQHEREEVKMVLCVRMARLFQQEMFL